MSADPVLETPRLLLRGLMLTVCVITVACQHGPERPSGVPPSAALVGDSEVGHWIDCAPVDAGSTRFDSAPASGLCKAPWTLRGKGHRLSQSSPQSPPNRLVQEELLQNL